MSNNQQASFSAERRVILVFAVSALVGIVLVGGALRYFLQRAALAQCRTNLESLAGVLARQCESEMAEAQRDLEFLAKTPAFQQLPYAGRIDLKINGVPENVDVEKRQFLTRLMNKAERFSVLYVLRPNADIYVLEPFRLQPRLTKRNLSDRPYYQECVRTKAPVISDSFVGADGMLAVVILVPILADSGDVTGYLGGAFYLRRLSQLVTKERIRPFDAGFIVDRRGSLIAHTDTELLKEGVRERFAENHPLLSRFLVSTNRTDEAGQESVLFDECTEPAGAQRHLTAVVPLSSGWGLGLSRDWAAVLAEARPVIWGITSLAGLLLALIGGLGVALAHAIGRRWDSAERALRVSEEELRRHRDNLEQLVGARTAELEAVNHELEAFSYSVSHDLKAPLRSVDGFVRILEQEYAPRLDDEGRRLLQVVRDSAQDMGRLVNDLLTFSRLSRKDLKMTRIKVGEVVQDARRQVEAGAAGRIIRWEIGDLPVAFGDEAMIREVLVNLLSNAVKFTRPRQEAVIAVEGRVEGDEVRYAVTDNGVGFDTAYKDKLFCVFQRLHTAEEFEGTGIGLALVQRIVQRHGGKVWAQGKVGQGATFGFRLPGKGNMESGKTKTEERI